MVVVRNGEVTGSKKPGNKSGVGLVSSFKGSSNLHPLGQAIYDLLERLMRDAGFSKRETKQWADGKLPTDEVMRRLHVRNWNNKKLMLEEKTRRKEITQEEKAELKVVSALLEVEPIMDKFSYRKDSRELGKWGGLTEEQRTNLAFVYLSLVYNYGGKEGRPAAAMAVRNHPEFREIYRKHGLADKDIDEFIRSG